MIFTYANFDPPKHSLLLADAMHRQFLCGVEIRALTPAGSNPQGAKKIRHFVKGLGSHHRALRSPDNPIGNEFCMLFSASQPPALPLGGQSDIILDRHPHRSNVTQ